MADLISIIKTTLIKERLPDLPPSGYTLSGYCKNPIGSITVRESKEHPGYLDMTVTNWGEVITTKRPVKHGEFATEYLATMIVQELPDATDFRWKTYETPPERTSKVESSQVYFIYSRDANKVKIGHSTHPASRLKTLQTGSPVPLEILATIEGGENLERKLHERFTSAHSHGEWFHMSEEIDAFIREKINVR